MCGIVGYLGPRKPMDVILNGLSQLEYRGYDSSGIAILDRGHFKNIRSPGKLEELKKKLQGSEFDGRLGLGHTRWATHGIPSERNAHPHIVDGVCLVHNGIIENYLDIKDELILAGAQISSDTDSELVAHLIARTLKDGCLLEEAVQKVLPKLHGAFAIVVSSEKEPDTMVAFKNGPPLIAGIGENELCVASDVQAFIDHIRQCVYLEDGDIFVSHGLKWTVKNNLGVVLKKQITTIDWTAEKTEKKGFSHFMLKEIFEQPRSIASALEPFIDLKGPFFKTEGVLNATEMQILSSVEKITIVACGTSYYAGLVGEYLFEKICRIPTEVEFASEFRYRDPIVTSNQLVVVISQSGETADTLAALRLAKAKGARILSICNTKNSSIDRESEIHFYMRSGIEVGVASTKALTSTLVILNSLAFIIQKLRKNLTVEQEMVEARHLLSLSSRIEEVLNHAQFFQSFAKELSRFKGFLFLGRGVNYPIALEGALKLKEIAYLHAEGYAAGEMKHGPIALVDSNMAIVVVAPFDDVYEKTISNLEEVRARGGQIIAFGTGTNHRLQAVSQHYLSLPIMPWNLNPILAVVPLQLLAFHVAESLGLDVDQPRNLAKSVTVE